MSTRTLTREARVHNPAGVGCRFRHALSSEGLSLIAEIKRRSPSRGALREDADARALAVEYQRGGASCLSVLTDSQLFGGSSQDLRDACDASDLPVLRKDFLTTHVHVHETHQMGADAMLVIVEDMESTKLRPLQELALTLGIDVLTEVRTEAELDLAVGQGAYMIAVNQRDDPKNSHPTVDYNKALRIAGMFDQLPPGIIKVAASGIGVPDGTPLADIAAAGYDAALVGEALVTASNPAGAIRNLLRS
ncbi:indole-3-glycerol phosphate synthase TrpC [Candidatus Poriferisodalis sp.]|uniref:indole-3-glycerol phosphate synthase TrpC n=1 Tax=Candidatus Poriferisodalis sp. TaxID=3101277 RepID=UPI003B018FEC